MLITDILDPSCICVPLAASDKTAAIGELVEALYKAGHLSNSDAVLEAILQREETRSTGIGEGLAVPHGKSPGCNKLTLAIGKPAAPIDFNSIDGQPCRLIFLLASPLDQMGPHIQALARISRIWLSHDFRKEVDAAADADAMLAAINGHQQ